MKFKRYINTLDAIEETQKKYGGISLLFSLVILDKWNLA
jgi:hypothetical protein